MRGTAVYVDKEDAAVQAHFSRPLDTSPRGLSRRRFLQMTAAGGAIAAAGPAFSGISAFAGPPIAHDDGVLVLVKLSGGNDAVNTVVPHYQSSYYDLRSSLAFDPWETLNIGNGLGFHPSLWRLKSRYDRGQVALVQGVGYDDPNLSHFESMAHWEGGRSGDVAGDSAVFNGWVGRWMDQHSGAHELTGISVGSSVPVSMVGETMSAAGLPAGGSLFGVSHDDDDIRMYDAIREMAGDTYLGGPAQAAADTNVGALDLSNQIAPVYNDGLPNNGLARDLAICARLVSADVGVRALSVSAGGFDTHSSQSGRHDGLLDDLDQGIEAFFNYLDPRFASRATLVTYSEFGRRPYQNGASGTDHGTAGLSFVVGSRVRGGLHGLCPTLTHTNLQHHVDFRSMYTTVVEDWLGGDGTEVLDGSYEKLGLYWGAPGNKTMMAGPPDPGAPHDYLIATAGGGIYHYGNKAFYGHSAAGGVAAVRSNPSGPGYWVATAGGGIEPFGDAEYYGSMAGTGLHGQVVDLQVTPSGKGYWLLGSDGGVFTFGDAGYHGSTGGIKLASPIVGRAVHPSGMGYWFVGADGGVFAYGDVGFYGSAGGISLAQPIVGMCSTPSGKGYWLCATDGGIFSYGDAKFYGSAGGMSLDQPITAMAATASGKGYWLLGADGGLFSFGDADYYSSLGGQGIATATAIAT